MDKDSKLDNPISRTRLEPRLRSLANSLPPRSGEYAGSDLLEDYKQEIDLLLWCLGDKVVSLPPAEQERYACACVHHLLLNLLQRERRQRFHAVSLETVQDADGQVNELIVNVSPDQEIARTNWLDGMQNQELNRELRALNTRDYLLIDLYYYQEWTDAQIAERLNVSVGAVKMQRNRILARLRRALGSEAAAPSARSLENIPGIFSPGCYLS